MSTKLYYLSQYLSSTIALAKPVKDIKARAQMETVAGSSRSELYLFSWTKDPLIVS